MKFVIDIADSFEVVAAGKSVTVPITSLSPEIVGKLVIHGLRQKVADAAAGAKKIAEEAGGDKGDIAKSLMQGVVDSLVEGKWAQRVAGAPVTDEVKVRRTIVANLWRGKATDEAKAAYKDMDSAKRAEFLDALFDKQKPERQTAILAMVADEIKAEAARAKRLAALASDDEEAL